MKFHPKYQKYFDRIKKQGFVTLNDWMEGQQILDGIGNFSLNKLFSQIPNYQIPDSVKQQSIRNRKSIVKIISSLTEEERSHPDPIPQIRNSHRIEQIEKATDVSRSDVKFFLKHFEIYSKHFSKRKNNTNEE